MSLEFLSISIRILFGSAAAYFFIRIPVGKRFFEELCSHLFLPLRKVEMSSEFFKNSDFDLFLTKKISFLIGPLGKIVRKKLKVSICNLQFSIW
jgi:hypothetical protein